VIEDEEKEKKKIDKAIKEAQLSLPPLTSVSS
jgi:hypothetical protein